MLTYAYLKSDTIYHPVKKYRSRTRKVLGNDQVTSTHVEYSALKFKSYLHSPPALNVTENGF